MLFAYTIARRGKTWYLPAGRGHPWAVWKAGLCRLGGLSSTAQAVHFCSLYVIGLGNSEIPAKPAPFWTPILPCLRLLKAYSWSFDLPVLRKIQHGVQYHVSGSNFTAISFTLHNLLLLKMPLVYHPYLFCKRLRLLNWAGISYLTLTFDHFSIALLLFSWVFLLEWHQWCLWHNFVFVVLGIFQFSWSEVGFESV